MEPAKSFRSVGRFARLSVVLLIPIVLPACDLLTDEEGDYTYQVPQQTTDGWETASLEDVGMDAEPFIDMMNGLIGSDDLAVHGIIVAKDGKLVFEEYFSGNDLDLSNLGEGLNYVYKDFDRNTLHCLASDSKSVTSILLGIAIDDGLIAGPNRTMFSFFPDYAHLSDPTKNQITLTHMLAMASGLPWNEDYPYDDPRNNLVAMIGSEDPIAYVLGMSTSAPPGTQFVYNSGTTNVLGEIVRRSSGMTLSAFAGQNLFAPLGIETYEWYGFPHVPEMTVASSTLFLRPRDMAKIGQTVLNGGVWNGTRIVSESWVSASSTAVISVPDSENPVRSYLHSYGLQWWLGTLTGDTEFYTAAGWGGQFIMVIPDHDMVVVVTAGEFDRPDYDGLIGLVDDYVLRAVG